MDDLYAISTVWIITWRSAWFAIVTIIGFNIFAITTAIIPKWRSQFPQPWLFPAMLFFPLLSIVWAGIFWSEEVHLSLDLNWYVYWCTNIHITMSVLSIVNALSLAFWFRKTRRAWLIFIYVVFIILFTWDAWFVGSMAITNIWL